MPRLHKVVAVLQGRPSDLSIISAIIRIVVQTMGGLTIIH